MPPRYFNFRGADDITMHIRTCRQFFRQLRKEDSGSFLRPVLRWVAHPEQGTSELILISWDRHLLLAKAAGALAAAGLNILSADLFLRADGIVIDLFRVCTTSLTPVTSEKTIGTVSELLACACTGEEIDFAGLIRSQDNGTAASVPGWTDDFPVFAGVHNEPKRDYTTVEIQAVDRIGLLYAIFNAIGSLGMEITHARINTEKGAAVDSFCVTDAHGQKITDPAILTTLRREVGKAAGVPQG
jgi:[protein-PII] uridylyltransferase